LEDYLLECIEGLQKAGDDEGRRRREIQKPKAWALLSMEWKALAMLAASNAAPDAVDASSKSGRSSRSRQRIGRRGGRVAISSLDDRLEKPSSVITKGKEPVAYRLAVLLAQKHRMGESWNAEWDSAIADTRSECEEGIHPVWERMAREAPLIAELGRFPTVSHEFNDGDSISWLNEATFDPLNQNSLLVWLQNCPIRLDQHQAHALQNIQRDLQGGKARPNRWKKWMDPALMNLDGDISILEGMLLAAGSNLKAADVFSRVENDDLSGIASKQALLFSLRNSDFSEWLSAISVKGESELDNSVKLEAWSNYQEGFDIEINSLLSGYEILTDSENDASQSLLWDIVNELMISDNTDKALDFVPKIKINNSEQMKLALNLVRITGDNFLSDLISSTMEQSENPILIETMGNNECPLNIRRRAAQILATRDANVNEQILEIFTLSADIEGLSQEFIADSELAASYPQRALLVWHLIPAKKAVSIIDNVNIMRMKAIRALAETQKDGTLTVSATALIALLSGIPSAMDGIHEKLDSDGVLALNEVRRALSAEGDGVVRENRIESLELSVKNAELTYLERRLFSALLNSLRLNRAAMDLQSGVAERIESALHSLSALCSDQNVAMRTIQTTTDLVLEHDAAINELELWYRTHNNGSAEHQIVRATIAQSKDDRINAGRSFRDAAMKVENDFERSALLLRKALIEFAHAGGWKEAVSLINNHPELTASVTSRFQLYLRTCADTAEGKNDVATQRIIEYISEREPNNPEIKGIDHEAVKRQLEVLDRALSYAADHRLPQDPFRGRVRAAQMMLRRTESSRRSELERRFLLELNEKKDVLEIVMIAEEVAEISPVRGLRMFETAIDSGNFEVRQIQTLVRSQKAMFRRYSQTIPVRQRRSLNNIALKPLVIIDTNILIDALKDDLLSQISQDRLGSFDWSVERAFVWMLRRRAKEGRALLCIPPVAEAEFRNRTKNPKITLELFNDVYIDHKVWKKTINAELLINRVENILKDFGGFRLQANDEEKLVPDFNGFLIRHKDIFTRISENKQLASDNPPPRTIIDGDEIYPERGDIEIMKESAVHAESTIPDVGSVLIATRDSDFKLIARALQDNFGFGVIWTSQQLNRYIV
jgi:hypothetical protein